MPELPEVETIKNELLPHVVGHKIISITVLWERMVRHPSVGEFCSRLNGRKIADINRRGKYLLFNLENGEYLIIHLKMTGSLIIKPSSELPGKHMRAVLELDNGVSMHFNDPRKFGGMWLVDDINSVIGKLGTEPLEEDFTPELLYQLFTKHGVPVKALLCDQTFIAGIGNMYADEALFAAGIHPMRLGSSLTSDEIKQLHEAIVRVLKMAINSKGASIANYYRPDGTRGTAHNYFKVAHKRDESCPVCGATIRRIVVRGRGTYFCQKCQPEKSS